MLMMLFALSFHFQIWRFVLEELKKLISKIDLYPK
jgi:hypothetical protein